MSTIEALAQCLKWVSKILDAQLLTVVMPPSSQPRGLSGERSAAVLIERDFVVDQ